MYLNVTSHVAHIGIFEYTNPVLVRLLADIEILLLLRLLVIVTPFVEEEDTPLIDIVYAMASSGNEKFQMAVLHINLRNQM